MRRPPDLTPYLDHLRELPFVRGVREAPAPARGPYSTADALVVVTTPQGTRRCPVELRTSHLTREAAEHVVHLRAESPDLMLLAPHVGRDLGDHLARARVNFMDLAGNCHVRFDDAFVARVQGLAAAPRPANARALRAPAYRALLALLLDTELLPKSTRAIAIAAGGVSPQTVADLRAHLVERGDVLLAKGTPRWSPRGRARAFDLLLGGWSTALVPQFTVGRYRAREREMPALEPRLARELDALGAWRWGGGAAAQRLTQFYRGDDVTLYLMEPPHDLARRLGLVSDRSGPVVILRAPCAGAFESPVADTVHPLLVYADLLGLGDDRAREAAGELRQKFLRDLDVTP
jgi:hypothetical protein